MNEMMNVTDVSVIVLVVLGVLGGARRGLSGELSRLICIIGAFLVAWKLFPAGAEKLSSHLELPARDLNWIAFTAITIVAYIGLNLLRHVFRLLLDFSFRGRLEVVGGAVFGLARAVIFCTAALFAAALIPSEPVHQALVNSRSGSAVIEHLVPLYEDWAEENPDFQLPDIPPVGDVELESLPWDQYLGPLAEEARENQTNE